MQQCVFKLFLSIDLPKQLTQNKEMIYRFIADLQDQSKTFTTPYTTNAAFFLNEVQEDTQMTIKIIFDKANRVLGTFNIQIPYNINYDAECTITQNFESGSLHGKYTLYIINCQLFNNQSPKSPKQSKFSPKSARTPSYHSTKNVQTNYVQSINSQVNNLLKQHTHSLSSKKEKTNETAIIDESPFERVPVSKSATIIQSDPREVRQFLMDDSHNSSQCINHRNHQDLSCLYYLDQASASQELRIANQNLKEVLVSMNNEMEILKQQISGYQILQNEYQSLQDQLQKSLQQQQSIKDTENFYNSELMKCNSQLNNKIIMLQENEKKLIRSKTDIESQLIQSKNEIKLLRENLYDLSEKDKKNQQLLTNLNSQTLKTTEYKNQLIKNTKEFENKIQLFDKEIDKLNNKIETQNKQINELKKLNLELENKNKSLNFQLKKNPPQEQTISIISQQTNMQEDTNKQIQVFQEIINQKTQEIDKMQQVMKKYSQSTSSLENENKMLIDQKNKIQQDLKTKSSDNIILQQQLNQLQQKLQQLQTKLNNENSKMDNQQNLIKIKEIQIQELNNRNEQLEKQIRQLEQISKQSKGLIECQDQQVQLLNGQINELQSIRNQLNQENTQNLQKIQELKTLISGMKEQRVAYIPLHGDPIDQALSEFINSVEDPRKIIEIIFRQREGLYLIGQKPVTLKSEQGKVYVKVGGGYIGIEEYLDVNLKQNLEQSKKVSKQKTPQRTPQKQQ